MSTFTPFSSRKATMFLAMVPLRPATRVSSEGEAVLRSTPTALTQSSTTAFRLASSSFCGISC